MVPSLRRGDESAGAHRLLAFLSKSINHFVRDDAAELRDGRTGIAHWRPRSGTCQRAQKLGARPGSSRGVSALSDVPDLGRQWRIPVPTVAQLSRIILTK